jgi:hypothetical protein
MVSTEGVKDILKQQTVQEPKFTQLDKLFYEEVTAVHP